VGTLPYISPEQLRGATLDGRSDLFSLGCVVYEMATGRRAFPGGDLVTLVQQLTTIDPPPPSATQPSLPPALDALVQRALAKAAADRFASAGEMATALRAVR
jgi:serine/threonine-protein kinase